jgi:zinc protease
VSLERLEQAVAEIIGEVVEAGLTDDEVERAKRRMVAEVVYARDSYGTAARLLGEALAIGRSTEDVEAWPDRIDAVSRRQVEEAARLVLQEHDVTALLIAGDAEAAIGAAAPGPAVPETSAIR